ncbi:hypothetical protein [Micromonospora rubida]
MRPIIIRAALLCAAASAAWCTWAALDESAARADDRPAAVAEQPGGLLDLPGQVVDTVEAVVDQVLPQPDRAPAPAAPPTRADPPATPQHPTPPTTIPDSPLGEVVAGVGDVLEDTAAVVDTVVDVVLPSAPPVVAPIVDAVTPEATPTAPAPAPTTSTPPAAEVPPTTPPTTLPATDASPLPDGEAATAPPVPAEPVAAADPGPAPADEPDRAAARWTDAEPDVCAARPAPPTRDRGLLAGAPGLPTLAPAGTGCPGTPGVPASEQITLTVKPPKPGAEQMIADAARAAADHALAILGQIRPRSDIPVAGPAQHIDPRPA